MGKDESYLKKCGRYGFDPNNIISKEVLNDSRLFTSRSTEKKVSIKYKKKRTTIEFR